MESVVLAIATVGALAAAVLGFALQRALAARKQLASNLEAAEESRIGLEKRLKPILDAELEAKRILAQAESHLAESVKTRADFLAESDTLKQKYDLAYRRYGELESEINSLEEDLEAVSVGLYKPHFTYADSDLYKADITRVRDYGKLMARTGGAVRCGTEWSVGGSKAEGAKMIKQYQKLVLRAFNAESDAAIANVSWNNFQVMKKRVETALEALNKFGTVMNVALTEDYLKVRLEELRLVFECAEKKRLEREEQRRQRAAEREEERVQRELLKEQEEAAKDEEEYSAALDEAKKQLEASHEAEKEAMLQRVKALEEQLAAAHTRKERAIAQAQLTRVGHVYVISNLGAFGEGVLKIGLTRRLDPEERIKELGDASVPFPFDLHALLYSEDAPTLETKLHDRFWERRMNWANDRKEFFRVTLEEVRVALSEFGMASDLLSVAEAREFRETLAAIAGDTASKAAENLASPQGEQTPRRRLVADPFADGSGASGKT
mgnify:CR=1 FL=1